MDTKNGDVFRWSYKKPPEHMPYHCKSCIAVVENGRLVDTFWTSSSDRTSWSVDEAEAELNLAYVGNLFELTLIEPWQAEYYDDADIVNLNHSNSTNRNLYRRMGAEKSPTKVIAVIDYKIEKLQGEIDFATRTIARLKEERAKAEKGDLEGVCL